jgi:hypothetical protein
MSNNFIRGHGLKSLHHSTHHRRTARWMLWLLLRRGAKLVLHALIAGKLRRGRRHPAGNHHPTAALHKLLRQRLRYAHLSIFPGGVPDSSSTRSTNICTFSPNLVLIERTIMSIPSAIVIMFNSPYL